MAMVTPASPYARGAWALSWPREAGRRRGHLGLINFDKVINRARRAANNRNREPVAYAQVCSCRNRNRVLPMPWTVVPIGRASLGGCGQTQASERDAARHQRPGNHPLGGRGGFPFCPRPAERGVSLRRGSVVLADQAYGAAGLLGISCVPGPRGDYGLRAQLEKSRTARPTPVWALVGRTYLDDSVPASAQDVLYRDRGMVRSADARSHGNSCKIDPWAAACSRISSFPKPG
jgi:hypothetical protein